MAESVVGWLGEVVSGVAPPSPGPATPTYVSADDVANYLGQPTPADARITAATAAAERWVIKRRFRHDAATLFDDPDVYHGTVMYAALLHTQRAQPQGLPGYNDTLGGYTEDLGLAMAQIYRLVGGADPAVT